MSRIEAVIFDWAGTTVDYGCFAPVEAFAEVFRHYHLAPTSEEIREPMGLLKIDHIRTMLEMPRIRQSYLEIYGSEPSEETVKAMFDIFEEKLLKILHLFAEPKPGVQEVVAKLRKHGFKIGSTTGYTDKMMDIIVPIAKEKGYAPDIWFSPDAVGGKGRPYPYMIFKNMEALGVKSVRNVLKIGDTVSDIKEGKNAGVWTAGVVVGSSELGLSLAEFEELSEEEREARCKRAADRFTEAGADKVFYTLEDMVQYLL
ncbi:phosphonoacetaldehyde hydrolase [Bariatricus massiliensis]|uniref:Phosphonoacetaldehyde hydrolase n=1 Tax=Bariatricus massiliensis TaxID=1745713 RepID=A0ABS8DI37_9FIRM|nr:phosphonoacetaldehyde hydrolase [Bariatricus massiliensis]MCB7304692.1 phosphonoacetaldehyde hydrolase [Bariatricus massiliensis]MCB7374843.1 phosphonoacetaldehyde hydrolase [Bariatricus massiliensis]MCB7388030.1 phosphonoacetaldehyde hydrolase [Bariatricus massiliensis]MCB7412008.1 phosphonoacetaldehyde hydrolase [Bariatricus massiliensis]MCQ5254201.1 phosphonoacetaldehyde hydrolase [Bariatricus massiliensis]